MVNETKTALIKRRQQHVDNDESFRMPPLVFDRGHGLMTGPGQCLDLDLDFQNLGLGLNLDTY